MKMNAGSIIIDSSSQEQMICCKQNNNKRRVKFAATIEVHMIDPITDPALKKALYYTREDIWIFQKRLQIEVALRRQIKNAKALQLKMKENKLYMDYLKRGKNTNDTKRPLQEVGLASCGVLEIPVRKRRRILESVE
jgi:hypothetical protein